MLNDKNIGKSEIYLTEEKEKFKNIAEKLLGEEIEILRV